MNNLMKWCVSGMAFAMVLVLDTNSQTRNQALRQLDMGFGVLGGVNVGGAMAETNVSTEAKALPMIGGIAEFGVGRPLSLALEPMYAVEGADYSIGDFDGSGEFGYVQLPILLRGNIPLGQQGRVFAFAGPNLALNVNATGDLPDGAEFSQDDIRPFSLLGDLGLGGSWNFTRNWNLIGNLRYTYGFMDVLEDIAPALDSWEPRGIKAGVGLMYHLPG